MTASTAGRWDPTAAGREGPVGREGELEALERLADGRLRCVVLFGDAGIGKTTLWRSGVELARASGCRALLAAPAEQEASLPFAALADLLEPLEPERFEVLPELQRHAVLAAIQHEPTHEAADDLAVSRAVLALVRDSAREEPLLLAIDDVQWLDQPSRQVLEFVARRVRESPVRLLVAQRAGADAPTPLGLDRALADDELVRVALGPLRADELDELIRLRLGLRLARPRLIQLERLTEGNPFYALEIARSLAGGAGELSIPHSLTDALAARVAALAPDARDALLLAAASVQPTADLVERAAGGRAGLAAAVREGMIEIRNDRVRFSHPLLASVVAERALHGEQRDAHRRLAAAATDADERAVHLARSVEAPDAAVAETLASAASAVAARGGPERAAELAEAAARLTPAELDVERRERLAVAAEHHVAAGDPARGRALLEQLIGEVEAGPARAALLWRLADTIGDSIEEPIRLCEQALVEAEGDPALTSEIHTALNVFAWIAGDLERSLEHCQAAVRSAEEAGDEVRYAIAVGEACHAAAIVGVPWDREAMERAVAIEQRSESLPLTLRPSFQLGVLSLVTDELGTARRVFESELERARRLGDEPAVFHTLWRLADLGIREGRWSEALRAAREAAALARQSGTEQEQAIMRMTLALILAHVGELEEARDLAESAYRSADAGGDRPAAVRAAGVLGFIELSAGEPERALEWLVPASDELRRMGTGELSIHAVVQNSVDALVAMGRLEEAEDVIGLIEAKGERSGRAWHRAVAARGRALVASARSEYEAARQALDDSLAAHEALPQPFELARTLLAAGGIERRAKHRARARDCLTQALELFDTLGAPLWAEKAAAELARIPGRGRSEGELSETQRRMAELVAEGLSNKEIAARLFVSVRTVEANLSKVYEKLGIHSRTELASRLSARS